MLPVTTVGSAELLDLPTGICVGRPVPGVDVALVRVTDEPIARMAPDLLVEPGEVGEVVVRGPVVSPRYADTPGGGRTDWRVGGSDLNHERHSARGVDRYPRGVPSFPCRRGTSATSRTRTSC